MPLTQTPTRISDTAPTLLSWHPEPLPVALAALYLATVGAIPTAPRMPAEMGAAS